VVHHLIAVFQDRILRILCAALAFEAIIALFEAHGKLD
jgi:hypothetical protein